MKTKPKAVPSLWSDERGSTATEYALLAVMLGVGIITALVVTSNSTSGLYDYVVTTVQAAIS